MINSRWALPVICLLSALAGVGLFQWFTTQPTTITNNTELVATTTDNAENDAELAKLQLETVPLMATDGRQTTLGEFNQPLIVINFWAPWCAPCREEIPDLIALQNKYAAQLQIVGLAADSAENVEVFEKDFNMNYPSFLTESLMPLYMAVFQNQKSVLPFTAILDANRDLVFRHEGEIRLAELEMVLSPLLSPIQ